VTQLSHAGVRALTTMAKKLQASGGAMRLCGANRSAEKRLRSLLFTQHLTCHRTQEEAVMALSCDALSQPESPGAGQPEIHAAQAPEAKAPPPPAEWDAGARVVPLRPGQDLAPDDGMAFHQFLETLRAEYARFLIEDNTLSLERIAKASGYTSIETMRRDFLEQRGASVTDYAERFSPRHRSAGSRADI
jgi:hypothetical protein